MPVTSFAWSSSPNGTTQSVVSGSIFYISFIPVRSYGTEDRDGQFAIPPQEEIFDYILFRGSDIKDIRVVNNVPRVPHDPAIMQMHVSAQNQSNFQPQFSMPPVMPNVGGQVGPFGGANNQPGLFGAMSTPNAPHGGQLPQVSSGLPFGQQQPQQSQQQQTLQQQSAGQQQQNNQQPQQKSEFDFHFHFCFGFFNKSCTLLSPSFSLIFHRVNLLVLYFSMNF